MHLNNNTKTATLYLTFLLVTISLIYVFNTFLVTKDAFYNTYQNQLENYTIEEIFYGQREHDWISYLLLPLWLLLKIFMVSLCLQTGLILNDTKLKFGTTFKIALTAEFVFLLPQLIKLAWFLLVKTDYTLIDVQQFYPLSALNLFKVENLPALLIYPFQTFNVFELLYWIILAGSIKQALDTDINHGIRVVFSGYIPALVLWVICVMFITVSLGTTT